MWGWPPAQALVRLSANPSILIRCIFRPAMFRKVRFEVAIRDSQVCRLGKVCLPAGFWPTGCFVAEVRTPFVRMIVILMTL